MPITLKQLERRKTHIGSSDMAPILGLTAFGRTAYQVWLEKTERIEPEKTKTREQATGNLLESSVLGWFAEEYEPIIRNQRRVAKGLPFAANIDALTIKNGIPVEAKTINAFSPLNASWGEAGSNQISEHLLPQCFVHMICTSTELCHVPAFFGGRGFVYYQVEWDKELADMIIEAAVDFWDNHVVKDIPPEDKSLSLAVAKRIRRTPNKTITLDREIYQAWVDAKADARAAEKLKDAATSAVLTALADAEAGIVEGVGTVTCHEESRKGFVVKDNSFRVLRFKKFKI